jgi:hypothetical protein
MDYHAKGRISQRFLECGVDTEPKILAERYMIASGIVADFQLRYSRLAACSPIRPVNQCDPVLFTNLRQVRGDNRGRFSAGR